MMASIVNQLLQKKKFQSNENKDKKLCINKKNKKNKRNIQSKEELHGINIRKKHLINVSKKKKRMKKRKRK